ncbi:MAG: hypothetical protein K1X57_20755 [Gemmataceae bacterium]|nr:hypothetical protein [Gemmataceae bacterium]
MIQKCDAIPDDDTAVDQAHLPIEHLAEMGCVAESLRIVDRFLRRLPKGKVLATVRMAELGAKICLDADDLRRMEHYLTIAESTEPFNTRKCDKGFSLNSVRQFRADNGFLDPADAIDEEQRIEAGFSRAHRQYKQSMATNERERARKALAEMEKIALGVGKDGWTRQSYLRRAVHAYAELKDADAVRQCVKQLNSADRQKVLDADMLLRLDMKLEAIARAQDDILKELEDLRTTSDPNIHFPLMSISRSLAFLVEHGKKDDARRWLYRALNEMSGWPVIEYGFVTSSVYESLAQAAAIIDGPAAANRLMKQAMIDAKAEKRSDFRQGAVDASLGLMAEIGNLDEAIEAARKLRSPTQRRKKLGTLLAKAKRWKELREVLSQVESPEEAADVAWWIKFELPGGEVR